MLRRLTLTVATGSVIAVGLPASAHAATRALTDGTGDVWTTAVAKPTRVPDRQQADIVRFVLRHSQRAVVIRTTFAELNRQGTGTLAITQRRTNTGQVFGLGLDASPAKSTNRWRGKADLDRNGRPIDCAVTHSIDYAANIATVRVPRTCLNNPRTVQATMAVLAGTRSDIFADNPITHGPTEDLLRYTARVRHGYPRTYPAKHRPR